MLNFPLLSLKVEIQQLNEKSIHPEDGSHLNKISRVIFHRESHEQYF